VRLDAHRSIHAPARIGGDVDNFDSVLGGSVVALGLPESAAFARK
jgi:hypothetical protein